MSRVTEHTRHFTDGTNITVHEHDRRDYPGHTCPSRAGSPAQQHRRDRLKIQAQHRRTEAYARGKTSAAKAAVGIRRRARQTKTLAIRGAKRWARGARYATRQRRLMATCCAIGGIAEITAGLAWSVGGLVWASLAIGTAVLSGGLLLGKQHDTQEQTNIA